MIRHRDGKDNGFALVLVLVIMMTLTVFSVGVIVSTGTNNALSRNFEKATQAMNMAEIGVKVAYRELINAGYLKTTHTLYKAAAETQPERLLETTLENYYIDEGDGYYVWDWQEGDANPLVDTDLDHGFRFCVYYSTENSFVIESEGWFGTLTKRVRAKGELEGMFQFSYFAARDMGEFVRGSSQEIKGKVHANGDLYIRPSGSTLRINTSSLSATHKIIRSRDAWGRPDGGPPGMCEITKNNQDSGIWVAMASGSPAGTEGNAFESLNPDWGDPAVGARALWGGVVRDWVPFKSPPPVKNLDPDGYYDIQAGLDITDTSDATYAWCTSESMHNFNETITHTVMDIDVAAMIADGDFPANGLIYCDTPTRFYNASDLDGNRLTIASNSTVYTKGDINNINKQGMSIMTKHRIYILSDNWDDNDPDRFNDKDEDDGRPVATNTTVNAALVDGAPTVDEYNWADVDGDHKYDDSNRNIYDNWDNKTSAGFNNPDDSDDPWANTDDLLENWGGQTLTKLGATIHLGGATMADNLDNSDVTTANGKLRWVQKTGYNPPTRVYSYDSDLANPATQPPFTPLIGHITSWEPY
ncbi:hypothetical protein ACFL2X_06015 [Candidatus Latescibacterota bacterium]